MGKKTTAKQQPLTATESLRRQSSTLERHICHNRRQLIKKTIQEQQYSISFKTDEMARDLLREVGREAEMRRIGFWEEGKDEEEVRQGIRQKQRLNSGLEEKLVSSQETYQKSSQIFKNQSLKQKYRHLLSFDQQSQEEKINGQAEDLSSLEERALTKVKQIYKTFRVSNIYKRQLLQKIARRELEGLICKGYMREQRDIVTLAC